MILCLQPASLTRQCLKSIYNTEQKLNKYKDNSNTRHRECQGRFMNTVLDPIWEWRWGEGGQSQGHLSEFNMCDDKGTMVKEDCLRERKCINRGKKREKWGIFHAIVSPAWLKVKSAQMGRVVDRYGKVGVGPDCQGPKPQMEESGPYSGKEGVP